MLRASSPIFICSVLFFSTVHAVRLNVLSSMLNETCESHDVLNSVDMLTAYHEIATNVDLSLSVLCL